ncbi:MAG: hypothetical protein PHU46_17125 [Rhodocyclaceae bacterium]|nr:hypothetical protein [Rhodocyclaceae bacterium]
MVLFVAAIGALAFALGDASTQLVHREQLEKRLTALRQNLGQAQAHPGQRSEPALSERRALAQFAAPWESMFAAVERRRTEDIALVGLTAEQGSRELVLKGEARSIEGLKVFVDGLSQEAAFEQVSLAGHKPLETTGKIVLFEVRARWR